MERKRLYKGHSRMIAGVCSGIAEYFNIDPTLVRLITVALALASLGLWGFIFWSYIICALIIPNPPH